MKVWIRSVLSSTFCLIFWVSTLLYYYTPYTGQAINPDQFQEPDDSTLMLYSQNLYCVLSFSETHARELSRLPSPHLKSFSVYTTVCSKVTDFSLVIQFARSLKSNIFIRELLEEPDIIFPFHYFW